MAHKELVTKATAYVEALFRAKKPDWVKFHTLLHAKSVMHILACTAPLRGDCHE